MIYFRKKANSAMSSPPQLINPSDFLTTVTFVEVSTTTLSKASTSVRLIALATSIQLLWKRRQTEFSTAETVRSVFFLFSFLCSLMICFDVSFFTRVQLVESFYLFLPKSSILLLCSYSMSHLQILQDAKNRLGENKLFPFTSMCCLYQKYRHHAF